MSHEDAGTGFDPGAAGHELQGRASGPEKSREVAPAVQGVMFALKDAQAWFMALAMSNPKLWPTGLEGPAVMEAKITRAIGALEAMLEPGDPAPKPKAPPSPSALFRVGFDYGAMAMLYEQIPEDARPARWGDKPAPPANWEDAWALVRAQIAAAK
jgi:hypothetical protein